MNPHFSSMKRELATGGLLSGRRNLFDVHRHQGADEYRSGSPFASSIPCRRAFPSTYAIARRMCR
jgi:hypothetical protein